MSNILFGSVCSGIEAASVAWHPLGWRAAWVAEIEPFPSAVLAHHYPTVPNLGDMTKIAAQVRAGQVAAPDVLVGGTPCQAFSVAGLRNSLDDARGQLTLSYVELANAIDDTRAGDGKEPCIIVWENVCGVLNTKDNAFGCFLAGLAGEDDALVAPGGKWSNAGAVFGPQRSVAWRVTDAQFFGVAQRRRRVFVVASARDGFDPCEVLFEFDGVRRDTAPSREAGQETAGTLGARASSGGGFGTDFEVAEGLQPVGGLQRSAVDVCPTLRAGGNSTGGDRPPGTDVDTCESLILAFGGNNQSGPIDVATARNACSSSSGRLDFESETFIVRSVALRGRDGGATAELGDEVAGCLRASGGGGDKAHVLAPVIAFHHNAQVDQMNFSTTTTAALTCSQQAAVCITGDITHTLKAEGFDASEDGTGRGQPIICTDTMPTLRAGSPNGGAGHGARSGDSKDEYIVPTTGMAVRRLTPVECERLQAFPDGYTMIPWRKKPAADCPDGPRYKALGNSMCVNNMRWIGQRIDQHLSNPFGDLI